MHQTWGVQARRYLAFIEEFWAHFPTTPCLPAQVALFLVLYLVWLARTLNYVTGFNFFLGSEQADSIDYKDVEVALTLRGIKHERGCHPRQVLPLLPGMLR